MDSMITPNLTLLVPHFSDCGKNESTKAFSAILVEPTLLIFWHSDTQSWAPKCQKIKNGVLDQYGPEHSEV